MHGKHTKKKSKRMGLSKKYKIQKKVREHNRKLKKELRKNPGKFGLKKADPGVPNLAPFKAKLIEEAKVAKLVKAERIELKLRSKNDKKINLTSNISELAEKSAEENRIYELKGNLAKKNLKLTDNSAKTFYKELKKVINTADVVLEVLDARDPLGSRCIPMEEMVLNDKNKRLVLILNKADLVPRSNLEAWLKYLRRELPTIIFKASTQPQKRKLSQFMKKYMKTDPNLKTSKCIGADSVMQLMKNYCRNCGIKTAITVGVVGLPNVGKSSLINSLKRSRACNVGATPGITRTLQEVALDSKVRLLDCPGVVFPSKDMNDDSASLRNARRVESIRDPIPLVEAIIAKAGKASVMLHYTLPDFKDASEFLALFAAKVGLVGKGGKPKVDDAARMILQQWNVGSIKYYSTPPVIEETVTEVTSALVSKMNSEFSLEEFDNTDKEVMEALPDVMCDDAVEISAISEPIKEMYAEVEEEEMELDQEESEEDATEGDDILSQNIEVELNKPSSSPVDIEPVKKLRWETEHKEVDLSKVSLKKLQKMTAKKQRKEKGRNEKKVVDLAQAFQALDSGNMKENYDFKDYFAS